MARKKNFEVGGPTPRPITGVAIDSEVGENSSQTTIVLLLSHGLEKQYLFADTLGKGTDEIVLACIRVLQTMVATGRPTPSSLRTIIEGGLRLWFSFCLETAFHRGHLLLRDVDKEMIEQFIGWLSLRVKQDGERWSSNTARTAYQKVKTVLSELCARQLLPPARTLFPSNPYPRATSLENRREYIRPMSDTERDSIIRELTPEIEKIYHGTHSVGLGSQLALLVFAIMLKVGLNPTPLLEIPRDLSKCFMDHPRINRKVLITFKRRAGKHTLTPLEPAETRLVSLDIYRLCEKAAQITAAAASATTDPVLAERLWVYETSDGNIRGLSVEILHNAASGFMNRHRMLRDDGTPLKMTSQLFRNSKLNRVWRESKGDLLATARSVGNTPAVAERYITVTPDMLAEHRLAGEVMVHTLSQPQQKPAVNTPVSKCRDPLDGEFAPKDGKPCMDFLSCFRCKSQVITGDDLHKLFSFYWAVLNVRERIGPKKWGKYFAWVIRIIDRDIAPRFNENIVADAKVRARENPHLMWRSREALGAIGSIV